MSRTSMGGFESPDMAAHDSSAHDSKPHVPVFAGDARTELDQVLAKYPTKMAALLPALWIVQRERGWISEDAIAEVAEVLELTPAYVKGVVSFYTMYHQHPVSKYFIQVCTTSPCGICGAEDVVKALLRHTGAGELGVPSADNRFTVIEVECLGACGFATPIMINDEFVESVTVNNVPEILARLA
ncbi:MAG TPA: NAD(P)H-dependent oxidoreductase subunit E [Gemmatimonadaceae bacterium]|nr:NAD(P)H-dependent oxidoreductase subunit E [Gemmatimonadaceae bacterium]